jgi:hypothetical protein
MDQQELEAIDRLTGELTLILGCPKKAERTGRAVARYVDAILAVRKMK